MPERWVIVVSVVEASEWHPRRHVFEVELTEAELQALYDNTTRTPKGDTPPYVGRGRNRHA